MCVEMIERHASMNDCNVYDGRPHNREINHHGYGDTHDEVDHAGRITALDGTLIGEQIPNHVSWPDSWHKLVNDLRHLPNKASWELFSGSVRTIVGVQGAGCPCGHPLM